MTWLWRLLTVLLLSIFVLFSGFILIRNNLIYVFIEQEVPPADMPRTEVATLPEFGDDPPLTVWKTEPEPGQPIIVYFMGNSGSLSVHEPRLRAFADAGFGIAAMAYRGGGGQPGRPSERALMEDATRVYAGLDRLFGRPVSDTERVIYGYSLGTGIAAQLAAEQEELAVILEASFPNLCAAAKATYAFLPSCVILRGETYETIEVIDRIGAPLLVLHGTEDDIIPPELGQQVYEAAAEPKFIEIYQGGGHENLARYGAEQDVVTFIRTLRGVR